MSEYLKIIQDATDKFHFLVKDGNRVDIEHSTKKLILTLNKWENEAFLQISLDFVLSDKLSFSGNKIGLENDLAVLRVYPIDTYRTSERYGDTDDLAQCEHGGVEVELELKTKPLSNVITLPIATQNLKFLYQPFLTTLEAQEGRVRRPFNVEGSFAVYHVKTKHMYRSTEEAKKYKTGKAFHIYRPRVTDTNGDSVWAKLDIVDNKLTITIPQDFLDSAVYPVIIDPTFGYETAGASTKSICHNGGKSGAWDDRVGTAWTMPENGTTSELNIYLGGDASVDVKGVINQKDSAGSDSHGQIEEKENTSCATSAHWETFTLSGLSLTGGVDYILNVIGDHTPLDVDQEYDVYYDSDGVTSYFEEGGTYDPLDDPWNVSPESEPKKYSIYCVYTTAAPPPPPVPANPLISKPLSSPQEVSKPLIR